MQKNGVDVDETYAQVSKYASLRFMLAHCSAERIDITHLDIMTTCLNTPLEDVVWCDLLKRVKPTWTQVSRGSD
jgi:hypothetical protein